MGSSAIVSTGERMKADGRGGVCAGSECGIRCQRSGVSADVDQRPTGASMYPLAGACVVSICGMQTRRRRKG